MNNNKIFIIFSNCLMISELLFSVFIDFFATKWILKGYQ